MIKMFNTLTHDVYDPRLYGFCFLITHDCETGDIIFQHNGLENITDKDLDTLGDLAKEIYPFVLEMKLQENKRKQEELAKGLKQALREVNSQVKGILDDWSKGQ